MYLQVYHYFCGNMAQNAESQINRKKTSKKPKLKHILKKNDQYPSKASRSQRQEKNELISRLAFRF